jgi:hypothetical protein
MIVVSDLLDMFARDPQIGANEATYMLNEIAIQLQDQVH